MSMDIYQYEKLGSCNRGINSVYRPYEDLANAVILQVVEDYRNHVISQRDMEKFFRSGWCKLLTSVDGEYLIKVTEQVAEDRGNIRRFNVSRGHS